jgi:uncharacterized iron-regulated protein
MLRRNRLLPEGLAVAGLVAVLITTRAVAAADVCVPAGRWALPGEASARPIAAEQLFADLARRRVVLLGETHDDPDHHRWQLQTVAGLYALHPKLVLALEMFPHRLQSVLDRWVAGELSPAQFLERSEWRTVWGHGAELYLPIFQFARMNRVPMLALNVDRGLTREVGEKGWAQVPSSEREGVSDPAPAGPEYLGLLWQSFRQHARAGQPTPVEAPELEDPAFRRFVDNMLLWDRTMAQTIAERVNRDDGTLVVGLVGSGHLQEGFGVARQLTDLGVSNGAVLLPWDTTAACDRVTPRLADALFGVEPREETAQSERPRLGIMLDQAEGGVRVQKVLDGSIAQEAGLREDDVIESIAGRRVADAGDVIGAVQRQAPGTWLPIIVRRGAQTMEVIARFPPQAPR